MGMLVATSAFAQKASDFKNSKAIIDKAIEYHDDEKYEKAIALYDLINRNDSLYITALSENRFHCWLMKIMKKQLRLHVWLLPQPISYIQNYLSTSEMPSMN